LTNLRAHSLRREFTTRNYLVRTTDPDMKAFTPEAIHSPLGPSNQTRPPIRHKTWTLGDSYEIGYSGPGRPRWL